jgi:phage-related protein
MLTWRIVIYTTTTGESPVSAFIDSLPEPQQQKILRSILLLQENGTRLQAPHTKPLGDGLWELRTVFGGDAFRIIYFTWTGRRFVLLHAFQKKTQKTPPGEIELARGRRADWLAQHRETP